MVFDDGVLDVFSSEGELGGALVVSPAEQAEVLDGGGSAECARDAVVLLEPGARCASRAIGAVPGALEAVAFAHRAVRGSVVGHRVYRVGD